MMFVEQLPDELWLEIISYMSYWDLFHCFSELNQRFDSIVYSKRLRINLKNDSRYFESQFLMKTFPQFIVGIRTNSAKQDIDISRFKNLLSIHLSYATDDQLEKIYSNYFQDLNQLNIVVCSPNNQIFKNILFGQNQLKHLTKCWCPNLDFDLPDTKCYQPCLTLHSLRLNFCYINTFLKLLSLLPYLIRFESAITPSSSSLNQSESLPIIEHFIILRLKLSARNNVTLADLDTILSSVPRLERLFLAINKPSVSEQQFNSIALANIVRSRLPNLKICGIKVNLLSTSLKLKLDDLRNISPLIPQVNIYSR
jgi:hypothetical protein